VLDIRLPVAVRRREKNASLLADELGKVGRDHCLPAAAGFDRLISRTGTLPALNGLDARRERDVA
jgi:hypothetical protein